MNNGFALKSLRFHSLASFCILQKIDVVLAHDVPELARATLKMLVDIKNAMPDKKQSSIIPFGIYTSENI